MEECKVLIEQRDTLRGEVTVPGDKSVSHRAILFGSLAKGTTEIDGLLMNEDCLSTIECLRKMQVGIEILPGNKVRIQGKGLYGLKAPTTVLNAGRSGTAIRLLLGVLSGQPFNTIITRDDSAIKKPVGKVVKPLRQMGALIAGKEDGNLCPLSINPSKLKGITYDSSILTTEVKSPILIAGLYADGETTINEAVKSRDHSELMLNYFGADLKIDGLKVTSRKIENLYAQHVEIPGDISIAAYFITAGLLAPNSDITIKNVGLNPTRTGILDVYRSMGAKIEISNERTMSNEKVGDIRVVSSSLNAVDIGGEIIPRLVDEIPVLAVAAAMAKGTTTIKNLTGFKVKDSRVKPIVTELSKMGASIRETEDGLVIEGGKPLKGTVIESYGDYAIVMAMSVAGLIAEGETMIRKAQIVDVAFPDFFTHLNSI
ncbi:MAG: 3-phosphoshikimate 1-carboxyvinyltransferase [Clostridia bacterium]|nr:3-phosphoshikimate 1-carboxyvinyltransferase [Clostridia bacterium]